MSALDQTDPAEAGFEHRLAAHCESGVTSLLLARSGLPVSEPLAFGIGSGLFFLHLPIERFTSGPTVSFRSLPGTILKKACRRLGVRYRMTQYWSRQKADEELRALVDGGTPVGLQVSVYWLPYLPRRFRFQFNAHNVIVYGRRGDDWLVSDPVLDVPVECPAEDLRRARFAAGTFAPRGRLYHVIEAPVLTRERLRSAILAGARETAHLMSGVPVPLLGARGIRRLAKQVAQWPRTARSPRAAVLRLANVVRMQEEIGTGGAGFRYLYAAFLQQAGDCFEDRTWEEFSEKLTVIGDLWRDFALKSARLCRKGGAEAAAFEEVAALLDECGHCEQSFFTEFNRFVRAIPHR